MKGLVDSNCTSNLQAAEIGRTAAQESLPDRAQLLYLQTMLRQSDRLKALYVCFQHICRYPGLVEHIKSPLSLFATATAAHHHSSTLWLGQSQQQQQPHDPLQAHLQALEDAGGGMGQPAQNDLPRPRSHCSLQMHWHAQPQQQRQDPQECSTASARNTSTVAASAWHASAAQRCTPTLCQHPSRLPTGSSDTLWGSRAVSSRHSFTNLMSNCSAASVRHSSSNTSSSSSSTCRVTEQTLAATRSQQDSICSSSGAEFEVHSSQQSSSWLMHALPAACVPYAQLMRLDKPIGSWLLAWPGLW